MTISSSSSTEFRSDNLVVNGNFNGNASGWILLGGCYYDNYGVKIPYAGSTLKKIVQYVPIKSGHQYIVSYSFAIDSGSATTFVSLGGKAHGFGSAQGELTTTFVSVNDDPLTINISFFEDGFGRATDISVYEIIEDSTSSLSSSLSTHSSSSSSSTVLKSTSSTSSLSNSSTLVMTTSQSLSSSTLLLTSSISSINSSSSSSTLALDTSTSLTTLSSPSTLSSQSSVSQSSVSESSSLIYSRSSVSSDSSQSLSSVSTPSSSLSTTSESSSSTLVQTTSSSVSSESSMSTSSSYYEVYADLNFYIEINEENPILCFCRHKDTIYAGTGPNGVILSSKNGEVWDTFKTVEDNYITSLFVWDNMMFIGTSPNANIYVYNFGTKKMYPWVITEDDSVSAFCLFNGKLYAGTSPNGIVYSLGDGNWKEEFRVSGYGITSMASLNDKMFIAIKGQVSPIIYDGQKLKMMFLNKKPFISDYVRPTNAVIDAKETEESSVTESFSISESSSVSSNDFERARTGENKNDVASLIKGNNEMFSFDNKYFIARHRIINQSGLLDKNLLTEEDMLYVYPSIPEFSISKIVASGKIFFCQKNIYSYQEDGGISIVTQMPEGDISDFVIIGKYVIYSLRDTLYITEIPQ